MHLSSARVALPAGSLEPKMRTAKSKGQKPPLPSTHWHWESPSNYGSLSGVCATMAINYIRCCVRSSWHDIHCAPKTQCFRTITAMPSDGTRSILQFSHPPGWCSSPKFSCARPCIFRPVGSTSRTARVQLLTRHQGEICWETVAMPANGW